MLLLSSYLYAGGFLPELGAELRRHEVAYCIASDNCSFSIVCAFEGHISEKLHFVNNYPTVNHNNTDANKICMYL